MSDGWKAGDLALCIKRIAKNRFGSRYRDVPEPRRVYEVVGVGMYRCALHPTGQPFIVIDGMNPAPFPGYSTIGFRKIQPYQERFAQQLLRAIPVKEGVDV